MTEAAVDRVHLMVKQGKEPRAALAEAIWFWHRSMWMVVEDAKAELRDDFPSISRPRTWGGAK
jgi:hypothetical protein